LDTLRAGEGWVEMSVVFILIAAVVAAVAAFARHVWLPLLAYGLIALTLVLGQNGFYHSKPRLLVPVLLILVPPALALSRVRPRGKYLWLPLDDGAAVLGHLGMSGQMLLKEAGAPEETHLRVRFRFDDDGPELRFVDQRTFGGLALSPGGADLPREIAHIAR